MASSTIGVDDGAGRPDVADEPGALAARRVAVVDVGLLAGEERREARDDPGAGGQNISGARPLHKWPTAVSARRTLLDSLRICQI